MWPNPRIPYQMASERPRLAPLEGKPLMVHVAVNIEYWPFDQPMPRGIIPAPHGAASMPPDVPNYAWVEYGMRCGMPRILRMLADRGLPASAFINAQVIDVYPALTQAVVTAGWELFGHGGAGVPVGSVVVAEGQAPVVEGPLLARWHTDYRLGIDEELPAQGRLGRTADTGAQRGA